METETLYYCKSDADQNITLEEVQATIGEPMETLVELGFGRTKREAIDGEIDSARMRIAKLYGEIAREKYYISRLQEKANE